MVRLVEQKRVPVRQQVHKRNVTFDCGCTAMFKYPWPHSGDMVTCLRHGPAFALTVRSGVNTSC